jgi:ABC-type sugar transport system substrate-binding protein
VGCAAAIMLLAANAQAADKVGVSMPNIKGPWFTPILFAARVGDVASAEQLLRAGARL